jgi:hypothetical protein
MATTAPGLATSALDVVVGLKAEGTEADVAVGARTLDHGTSRHRCRGLAMQVARTSSHRWDLPLPQLRQSKEGARHMLLQTRHHHQGQYTLFIIGMRTHVVLIQLCERCINCEQYILTFCENHLSFLCKGDVTKICYHANF